MTDERRDLTPPEVETVREAGEGECDRLKADVERLTRERDAALAMAFLSGRNLFGLPDDAIFRRAAEAFAAWLDGEVEPERVRISAAIMAAYRKAAGLDPEGGNP